MLLLTMAKQGSPWDMVSPRQMADIIMEGGLDEVLIIDSRSFLEFNTHHVTKAINVCCSKLVKRRLQQDKVLVRDLLAQACPIEPGVDYRTIVYDQCTTDPSNLSADCFLMVLLRKLVTVFNKVALLRGGFLEFQASHPSLCESKMTSMSSSGNYKCPPLTSMSQPCLPVTNIGPTKILPFLYLGSQHDALSQETMQVTGINYCLNVSTTCPKPPFIQDAHFLRIPVNDNYSDKLLPYFQDAFQFLDKVREANGCVIVHCLAGISRSPTLAIAYIMRYLNLSTDDAYRYVKDKRPTISPNFNFLGQLLEYEKQLKHEATEGGTPSNAAHKRQCIAELRSPTSPTVATPKSFVFRPAVDSTSVQSPTTALAKLSFGGTTPQPSAADSPAGASFTQSSELPFPQFPTTSLDKLSFTPCFVTEDSAPKVGYTAPSVHVLGTKQAGTKRPRSTSSLETSTVTETQTGSSCCSTVSSSTVTALQAQVTLRSPETKAKRHLRRPNSIAFSTLDFRSTSCESSSLSQPSSATDDQLPGGVSQPAPGANSGSIGGPTADQQQATKNATSQVQMRHSTSTPGNIGGAHPFEQGRKSRSLEDILNSPEDESSGNCHCVGLCRAYKKRSLHAADMFSQTVALDRLHCRCRGVPDPHQSNSSISSGGSHNSLHGSLEIIQVS